MNPVKTFVLSYVIWGVKLLVKILQRNGVKQQRKSMGCQLPHMWWYCFFPIYLEVIEDAVGMCCASKHSKRRAGTSINISVLFMRVFVGYRGEISQRKQ